ncbi:MAG: DUF3576 domain-containing protein [Acetobacteraceae bacterium]|nr:DUF3576 domain-containing protein [Acetobacteraceae bacterium]
MSCSCRSASIAALAIPLLLALTSCGGDSPAVRGVSSSEYNVGQTGGAGQGKIGGDSGLLSLLGPGSKGPEEGAALGVNAYLWRGALDTLSFMPLASADPFGGVIITDWYQPPASDGERFKATVYILGRQLRSDGIRVSIFRQVYRDGQWVDADVSPQTVADIENKVLERARDLRASATASR